MLIIKANIIFSQISPGDLSKAHSELEGISNCTQCHTLGDKVSNDKCLACHDVIETNMLMNRGYHASREVKNKDCFKCHSEHHGIGFNMIRLDEDNFDHTLTGYKLEGQHKIIECRDCHKSEFVKDSEIRKNKNTFLGMGNQCIDCHDDFHQGSLSKNCTECHNIEAFRPAPKFDHNRSDYKLKGKHLDVDCKKCHIEETRNGFEYQKFTGITFNNCNSCHNDPHNNQLGTNCKQCHTESSFNSFIGKNNFNHSTTDFSLKGKHSSINCFSCHKEEKEPLLVFQDKLGIASNDCNSCHEDIHEGKFGVSCIDCHDENSFTISGSIENFDHSKTQYTLIGMHIDVDCKKCHIGKYTEPIAFNYCIDCHNDYHNGQFKKDNLTRDCADCHDNFGFESTLFTIEEHNKLDFQLTGGHLATPCFACHLQEAEWIFKDLGTDCISCHEDIHKDYISEKFYPNQACTKCHITETWSSVDFDHTLTEWILKGQHLEINCTKCHISEENDRETIIQEFKGKSKECFECHENIHGTQFELEGITDCKRCHESTDWFPYGFDHSLTKFPLEGKHAEVDCKECHKEVLVDNELVVQFKIEKFECIDCHQ